MDLAGRTSTVDPTGATPDGEDLPPPLVRLGRHPLRWLRNRAVLTLDALVLAHVGALIAAALYYLLTQTDPSVKHWWDSTVTPASLRHDVRDVGEGVLASCLAQGIVWNHFTRSHRRAGRRFHELRHDHHVPVGLAAVVSAVAVGAVAFGIGELVLHLVGARVRQARPHGSLLSRTATLWTTGWDKKALGFAAAVVARRPLHVLFDSTQRWFAGQRAATGKPMRWYHPPVFVARVNDLASARHEVRPYPWPLRLAMATAVAAGLVLAGIGFWVLTYRA